MLLQARRLRKADPVKNAALYAEHEKEDMSLYGIINRTLYRPFYMLYKEPILVLVTLYISFIYGILYARESPLYYCMSSTEICVVLWQFLKLCRWFLLVNEVGDLVRTD
jgi:hypothetical protein